MYLIGVNEPMTNPTPAEIMEQAMREEYRHQLPYRSLAKASETALNAAGYVIASGRPTGDQLQRACQRLDIDPRVAVAVYCTMLNTKDTGS